MKKSKLILFVCLLSAVSALTSGCISFNTGKSAAGVDGGLFRSLDKGNVWQQVTAIASTGGKVRSFAGINVSSLAIDQSDHKALYFGSEANGLFYSYDGANSWMAAESLIRTTIRAIAVDPFNKCTVYAAAGNRVYKTTDCSRTWTQIYYDNDVLATVDTMAIDHFNNAIVYIGVSRGDVIKSYNYGADWQTVHRVKDKVEKIVINPNDSRDVFVTTNRLGLYRTEDGGENWYGMEDLTDDLKEWDLGIDLRDLVITKGNDFSIYLATYWGIVRSDDKGKTWNKIELIPTEKKATINAIAVNSQNKNEIYYVTNTTFYRSSDAGANWATIKLPTARAGMKLIVDHEDPNVIYMGVWGNVK